MISYLLAGPAEEPLSLAQAKAFLRLDGDDEDGLVATLIGAARMHMESVTGRALIAQSWRLVLDRWPPGDELVLPIGPVRGIEAVTAFGDDDEPQALDAERFGLVPASVPGRVLLPAGTDLPPLRERLAIEIDFIAGMAETAAGLPADIGQALLSLVGYWFEHRDAVIVAGSGAVVPAAFDRLVSPYKRVRL